MYPIQVLSAASHVVRRAVRGVTVLLGPLIGALQIFLTSLTPKSRVAQQPFENLVATVSLTATNSCYAPRVHPKIPNLLRKASWSLGISTRGRKSTSIHPNPMIEIQDILQSL